MSNRDYGAETAANRGEVMHAGHGADGPWTALVATEPVAVAQVGGVLQRGQTARLCQLIIDVVAAHQEGLVIDLAPLMAAPQAPPEALAPLPGLLRAFAGRPVVICGRPAWLRPPRLPAFRDRAEASRHVLAAETPPLLESRFDRFPGAAADGRQLVTDACERWDLAASLAGPAQLVVTELINNALLHAGTDLALTVTRVANGVHIAVHDGSTVLPVAQRWHSGPPSATGRGLTLVEAFAAAWGATALSDGKIVWAELHPPD